MKEKVVSNIGVDIQQNAAYANFAGLSLQNLFTLNTGKFPSCLMFNQDGRSLQIFDVDEIYKYFIENTPEDENLEVIKYWSKNLDTDEVIPGYSFVFHKSNLYARIEKNISESYILYLNEMEEKANEMVTILAKFYITPEEESGNVFTLAQNNSGFYLTKAKINPVDDFDVKLQYNDDFEEINEDIEDFIEDEEKSGIIILHGEKGAGKTTYIRRLITDYPDVKFVTIPPAMVGYLSDPSFTAFMHNRLSNTVIILEDCENAILDRKISNTANSVSVLLNIGDGLMSDDLGIKFICTFNSEIGAIDSALLRKGRLAVKYEFKKLAAEKVKILLPLVVKEKIADYKEQIKEIKADEEMPEDKKKEKIKRINKKIAQLKEVPEYTDNDGLSLADIYNIEDKSFVEKKKSISF